MLRTICFSAVRTPRAITGKVSDNERSRSWQTNPTTAIRKTLGVIGAKVLRDTEAVNARHG
eukprot:1178999-Prorocentrum_minimum.AAC.1